VIERSTREINIDGTGLRLWYGPETDKE